MSFQTFLMYVDDLFQISKDRPVILSTLMAARVSRLAVLGEKKEAEWQKVEAQTVVTPQLEALESGSIPLWVIILAAVIGALLLLLLIFALYKVNAHSFTIFIGSYQHNRSILC